MDDLAPEILLSAYCQGLFPMSDPQTGEISFYSPDPRAIIPLDNNFHIPHGLKRSLKRKPFEIRIDTSFQNVMQACARIDKPDEQWIDERIIRAYTKIHDLGFAHSIECWDDEGLQGGLYGIAIGRAFFGESMFHKKRDASKIALVALVDFLRKNEFTLLDTQWMTPHLKQFGAFEIPRKRYLKLLHKSVGLKR